MKKIILASCLLLSANLMYSQGCCSGGSGSPISGAAASGVLLENQMEISTSYQFISSHLFKTNNNKDTVSILSDTLRSDYLFFRTDYGLSEKLTMSVALGYFLDKSVVNRNESYSVSGVSDLILFPRYNVFNFKKENHRTELTLGLGLKLPIGSHTDSSLLVSNPIFGDIYAYNPPIAQLTNGSQDAMFYAFIFRTYPKKKFSVFANSLFIKKAFNSLGEKFGDYSSMSVFFSKSLPKNFGLTAQLKYEHVGEIEAAHGVDLVNYNVELESTGLSKMLFVPQLSYSKNGFTYFATADLPLYEDLNGSQFSTQYQVTVGLSYRFLLKEAEIGGVLH
ncbi:hypothetical protein N8904_01250 [Flavobacteriales bacterium]|nr:hypothetical protein [Flavobacteriales bacterium]MDA7794557.1 hypothetical protein [Flavobacteriales bacterium]